MATFREVTEQIIKRELKDDSRQFNLSKFEFILGLLRPHLELDKDQMVSIFQELDKDSKGFLMSSDLIELMGTLSEAVLEEDEEERVPGRNSRVSLTYDSRKKVFRPSLVDDGYRTPGDKAAQLDYSFIDGLGLEKLSDLKQLFQVISQTSNGTSINKNEVYRVYDDLPLYIEFEEVKTICELLSDTKSNLSISHINTLLSEIEKKLIQSLMENEGGSHYSSSILLEDITGVKVAQKKLEIKLEEDTRDFESDPNDPEEEDYEEIGAFKFEDMEEEYLEPLTAIWDNMANMKHKTNDLIRNINAILKIKDSLRKFFVHVEKISKALDQKVRSQEAKENVFRSKIGSLEAEIKSSASIIESLLKENEQLFVEINAQASVIKELEQKDRDISGKIHEVMVLESKNKAAETEVKYQIGLVAEKNKEIEEIRNEKEQLVKKLLEKEDQDDTLFEGEERKHLKQVEDLTNNYKAILIEKEKQISKCTERIGKLESLYEEGKANLAEREEFIIDLKQEIEDLKMRLENTGRMSSARLSSYGNLGNQLANRASLIGQRLSNALSGSARVSLRATLNGGNQRFSNLKGDYKGLTPAPNGRQETIEEEEEDDDEAAKQNFEEMVNETSKDLPDNLNFESIDFNRASIEKKGSVDLRKTQNHPLSGQASPVEKFSPKFKWDQEESKVFKMMKIDEAESNNLIHLNRDFLSLFGNQKVKALLKQFKDDSSEFEVFSEKMIRINRFERKEKNLILVTKNAFYSLRPQTFKLIRRIPLGIINKITLAENSATLCCVHVYQEFDYLIETFKRADFVVFLLQMFKLRNLTQFKVDYQVGFVITNSDQNTRHIGKFDQTQLKLHVVNAYKSAIYYGFISKLEDKFLFGHTWKEFFGVLTSVGLLLFKNAGDLKNGTLVPILGSHFLDNPEKKYGKKFAIKIISEDRTKKELFGFDSMVIKNEWSTAIKKLQNSDVKSTAKQEVESKKEALESKISPRSPRRKF